MKSMWKKIEISVIQFLRIGILCAVLSQGMNTSVHAQFNLGSPVSLPVGVGSGAQPGSEAVPQLVDMGPYMNYEFRPIRFDVTISNSNEIQYFVLEVEDLPVGATFERKNVLTGELVKQFSWVPDWNQSGTYEITFIARNQHGESRKTVTIYVLNFNRPHISIRSLYMKSRLTANGGIQTHVMPMIISDGDEALESISMRLSTQESNLQFLTFDAIRWDDIEAVDDPYFGLSEAFIFDTIRRETRGAVPFTLSIEARTARGEVYEQVIEFTVGLGDVADNFYSNNAASVVFKHRYQADMLAYTEVGLPSNPFSGSTQGLQGELVAKGDFDGDGYEDMVFFNGENRFYYAMNHLDEPNPHAINVMRVNTRLHLEVAGAGDFNGDGIDTFVVIDRENRSIEKWPLDVDAIERGWVDAWPIPEGYDLLKIADFNGDLRSDFLWYDTVRGMLVLWNGGVGGSGEIDMVEWTGTERVLGYENVQTNRGCEIVFHHAGQGGLFVVWLRGSQWVKNSVGWVDWEAMQYLGVANTDGERVGSVILRNREQPDELHFVEVNSFVSQARIVEAPIEADWVLEHMADINGNGKEDLVWSKREFDAGLQRDKKVYHIFHMNGLEFGEQTVFELPIEWELSIL
jgi:PKD repeat protein